MSFEKKSYLNRLIKEAITRDEFIRLVRNRQAVPVPARSNLLRTGTDTRRGFAGIEQYYGPVTPYRNPTIASPGMTARRGQRRWEDLPSTRRMLAASGNSSAYNNIARRNQNRESAAYEAILARLNARPNADARLNQERARRLAPLVAKNYKLINGKWKSVVNDNRLAKVRSNANAIWNATAPNQQIAQQTAPVTPAVQAAPAATTAPAVPASPAAPKLQMSKVNPSFVPSSAASPTVPVAGAKPSLAATPIKKTASSKLNDKYNKQGEIKMTKKAQETQKAYLRGFCKVANAYGVDPEALLKYAQSPALQAAGTVVRNFLGRAKGAGKRFWELLRGGNKELKTTNELLKQHKANWLDLLKEPRYAGEVGKLQWNKDYAEALKQFMNAKYTPELQNEALKVLGARVGAGTAGLVGAHALLSGGNNNQYPYAP